MDTNKSIESKVEVGTESEVQDLSSLELALVGGGVDGTHN